MAIFKGRHRCTSVLTWWLGRGGWVLRSDWLTFWCGLWPMLVSISGIATPLDFNQTRLTSLFWVSQIRAELVHHAKCCFVPRDRWLQWAHNSGSPLIAGFQIGLGQSSRSWYRPRQKWLRGRDWECLVTKMDTPESEICWETETQAPQCACG